MNIKSLSELIPDCRNSKNQHFSADSLVFISIVSILCGAETWDEIEYFGNTHYAYFKQRLPDLDGIPSHDTFNRFFSALDIGWFEEIFRIWVNEICERIPGVVAIDGKAVCPDKKREENRGHGRYEFRECVVVDFSSLAKYFIPGWTGVKTLAKITATRQEKGEKLTEETRYYISSLPDEPKLILQSVRSHWQVENNLHWQLDVSFREDYTRKTGNAAVDFSTMAKVALMLLKQSKLKLGMAGKRKVCGWNEKFRDQVIGIEIIK